MAIFQRLLSRLKRLPAGADGRLNLAVELPGSGDRPLWRIELQAHSEPHGDGERLRLRAHVQASFASALRPALREQRPAVEHRSPSLAERASRSVQRAGRRALAVPLVQALAEPLLRLDLNTWVEVNASTASLDQGSRELLPQGERLAALGIVPVQKKDAPLAQSWAGEAPGGFAQVSLLQVDKRHLPEPLQRRIGERPFQFAAAVVNTVEEK